MPYTYILDEPTWSRTHICMTLPLLTAHFSWPLPFLQSQKVVTLPLFPTLPPLLIADKSDEACLMQAGMQVILLFFQG